MFLETLTRPEYITYTIRSGQVAFTSQAETIYDIMDRVRIVHELESLGHFYKSNRANKQSYVIDVNGKKFSTVHYNGLAFSMDCPEGTEYFLTKHLPKILEPIKILSEDLV